MNQNDTVRVPFTRVANVSLHLTDEQVERLAALVSDALVDAQAREENMLRMQGDAQRHGVLRRGARRFHRAAVAEVNALQELSDVLDAVRG